MTQPSARPSRLITALLLALAVASVVLAIVYFSTAAKDLPSFLPGHQAGLTRHHAKHGIGALALAVVLAVSAYFSLGARERT
jgi:amino acid permease